jgi:hypothetical protein
MKDSLLHRLILATAFLIALAGTEASACAFTPFYFVTYGGSGTSTHMQATSGKPCAIPISTGGRHSYSAIAISTQPRNGTARAGASSVTYQSRPGYTGRDFFEFRMTGSGPSRSGTSSVQVDVTVQ